MSDQLNSTSFIHLVFNSVPCAAFYVSAKGEVIIQNPVAESFLTLHENNEPFASIWAKMSRQKDSGYFKITVQDKSYRVSYIKNPGDDQWLIFAEDKTELNFLKDETKHQKAHQTQVSKMVSLGEMAGGVAHEINNPLAIMMGHAEYADELVSEMGEAGPNETQVGEIKNSVHEILENGERIARIVKGLREFSRDGSQDPLMNVPVEEIIEDTLALCSSKFFSAGIVVDVCNYDRDLTVFCRKLEISQVLLNLLMNAHDVIAGTEDAWIRVEVQEVNSRLRILVTDSGPGIVDELRDRIFQPFFSTKKLGEGTGLGLSISMGMIHNNAGKLSLAEDSDNTCFIVELNAGKTRKSAA